MYLDDPDEGGTTTLKYTIPSRQEGKALLERDLSAGRRRNRLGSHKLENRSHSTVMLNLSVSASYEKRTASSGAITLMVGDQALQRRLRSSKRVILFSDEI